MKSRQFELSAFLAHISADGFLVWRWRAIPTLQSPTCECRLRHLSSQQVQSSHTITVDRMARPARFERAAFRLGVWKIQYPRVHHNVMSC